MSRIMVDQDAGTREWKKTEIQHSDGDGKAPAPVWRVSWYVHATCDHAAASPSGYCTLTAGCPGGCCGVLCRSVTGNVLAVSSGDQRVTLYKQDLSGKWVEWHWQKGDNQGRWEVRAARSNVSEGPPAGSVVKARGRAV